MEFLVQDNQKRTCGMKRQLMVATAACFTLAAGTALADCAADVAELGQGVVKDGSTAPLAAPATPQTGGDVATTASPPATADGEVAKDGSMAPLGTDPAIATSAGDAQAQSQGGATAAEQAQGAAEGAGTMRAEALARAQVALDAGDEAACMEAVKEATGL
jgi:hypothetical protein